MNKFKTGDKVFLRDNNDQSAPIGATAIVNKPAYNNSYNATWLNVVWTDREKYNNHRQMDGGYSEDRFELVEPNEEKRPCTILIILP